MGWPFRGTIRGIDKHNFFEFLAPHASDSRWFPATITSQRQDGYFEVTVQEPDRQGTWSLVKYPSVHKENLREADSKRPLSLPERFLLLEVPKQNPLGAVLSVDGTEHVTHHFGRPSPSPAGDLQKTINCKVNKERSVVTGDVGHSVIRHFVSGE